MHDIYVVFCKVYDDRGNFIGNCSTEIQADNKGHAESIAMYVFIEEQKVGKWENIGIEIIYGPYRK